MTIWKEYSPDSIVIVYPPAPPQAVFVTFPSAIAIIFVPSDAPISIPLWNVDAPEVGAVLFPYPLVISLKLLPTTGNSASATISSLLNIPSINSPTLSKMIYYLPQYILRQYNT